MSDLAFVTATIHGHVQGVFYRAYTSRIAKSLGLKGYVRNVLHSNAVEVCAEGDRAKLEEFTSHLEQGPPESLVEQVDLKWSEFTGQFVTFEIR
jgi:acylphosphatase